MANLVLPEILDIPEKLYPLITELDNYRYFLIEGGRGGAKSQSTGRFILYLGEKYNLRIVCGREVQNSIDESVYSLLSDVIRHYHLCYQIMANRIFHRDKDTTINFRGFREQGAFNIQGMEGVDILWIDEAQAITKATLDVLIPTIRKDNAKIFFTMNRHVVDDPVYNFLKDRDDCLHIHINYHENKHVTQALLKEAQECKEKSLQDYNHIWLGIPLDRSEDSVYTQTELDGSAKAEYPLRKGYGLRIGGFDVARYGDDKCAVVILQQMGAVHWAVIHAETWDHKDLSYTTGRILMEGNEWAIDTGIIDEDGLGAGPLDMLNKGRGIEKFEGFRNLKINPKEDAYFANYRTKYAYSLKDLMLKEQIYIPQEDIRKELANAFRYTFDNYQRKILISKEVMRSKHKIKSPNLADALIMAVSKINNIKQEQDSQYVNLPQYSSEADLYKIGGIK